jgi:FkbM family methyltransferase
MIYRNPNYCMGNRSTLQKLMVALGILSNPWMLVLDKLGLVKNPQYFSRTGMRFTTRGQTTDINDAVVVLSGNEYPKPLIGFDVVDSNVPVVLDCGGHIGSFTLFIKSHWPNAKIFTLEPVPDNLDLLQKNLTANNLTDVTIIPLALYGQSGTFYIDLVGKQFDAVSLSSERPQHNSFITVEALTLPEVMRQYDIPLIDLMKLDVEGAEYNIFEHSLAAIGANTKRIIMEFHPAGNKVLRDQIVQRLCNDGPFELIYETKNILGFQNRKLT